ncbi:MAP3K12-binding inhibitory protein 1 [Gouania willdenowi]|uniref:MAP3K12 binding inhibitory protein 1 n=1 Tax=Gouania willdenowi TaxID=441366 RepID=A0A8C5E717_GOUWI|nr:MAP3K12-binding inhibitory protein 1 [Gouania willdenowi]
MVETMKQKGSCSPPCEGTNMSNHGACVSRLLTILSDFSKQLNLDDDVLKVQVNPSAATLPSSQTAHVYNCLQEHITKMQALSESLKTQLDANPDSSSAQGSKPDDVITSSLPKQLRAASSENRPCSSGATDSRTPSDDVMVQIRAGKSEIERRISAFMERKQMEINENNVREFCNVIDCNQENSCARTDAVFTPYPGFKSHIKVSRVVNAHGPQTRCGGGQGEAGAAQQGPSARNCGNAALEERLQSIEAHLKLPTVASVPLSVYQRLKKLEDRILELEGLSPEYFQTTSHLHKRPKTAMAQSCSLSELDEKISAVKAALMRKVTDFDPGYGPDCPL